MKRNQTDVMEVEVEEMLPEVPLEKVIETALVKANITDQVIAKLNETYGGMKLRDVNDAESYLEIKEARREVRKVGILTEKITKKGREEAVKVQRLWLDKEKEILGKIAAVQDPLDEEIKKYDDEKARIEKEEADKREEEFIAKQSQLLKYGAEYRNGSYELGHISYELEIIKQADEDMWNDTILPKYRKVFEEKEAERVAEEDKRKAEQDKFAEEQRIFKEQQELFTKQQAELQKQKDDAEKEANAVRLQKQRDIDAANEKKWRDRLDKLNDIGWNGQFAFTRLGNDETKVFTYDELVHLPDDVFSKRAKEYNDSTYSLKKELEEKRLAKIEEDKQAAIKKALEDQKAEEEEKRLAKIEQDRLDAIKKQAELDASNDKVKYEDVVSYLLKAPIHEMKSGHYRAKMNVIKDFLNDLKN